MSYSSGDRVRIRATGVETQVIFTVPLSLNHYCPFCMRKQLGIEFDLRTAYYLEKPNPDNCCRPYLPHELYLIHDVNNHTFASFLHYLKKKSV